MGNSHISLQDKIKLFSFIWQQKYVPLSDGGHVLVEVHEREDGEEADPGLLQPVDDSHEGEVGAALARHPLVGRFHVLTESL